MSYFSAKLKELRKEKGYTQEQMANILEIGQSAYAKWENGRTEPNFGLLLRLSKILDVSTDYLLGNESENSLNDDHLHLLEIKSKEIYSLIEDYYNKIEPKIYDILTELEHQQVRCEEISIILNRLIYISKRRYGFDIQPLIETMINRWISFEEQKKLLLELVREGKY